MTVDKFGHHYNLKYTSVTLKGNVSRLLGINIDEDNNLDIQNKRIRNFARPAGGSDAVNQAYVHSQNKNLQEILKKNVSQECSDIRQEISYLKHSLNELYNILSKNTFSRPL